MISLLTIGSLYWPSSLNRETGYSNVLVHPARCRMMKKRPAREPDKVRFWSSSWNYFVFLVISVSPKVSTRDTCYHHHNHHGHLLALSALLLLLRLVQLLPTLPPPPSPHTHLPPVWVICIAPSHLFLTTAACFNHLHCSLISTFTHFQVIFTSEVLHHHTRWSIHPSVHL